MARSDPQRDWTHVTDRAEVCVIIAASREIVFRHLVERDKLVRWMGISAEFDAKPGNPINIELNKTAAASGHFVEVVPNERVVFTWGWVGNETIPPGSSTVEITLKAVGDKTEVTLVHTGLPDENSYVEHGRGWTHYLARLTIVAAGGDPGPDTMV